MGRILRQKRGSSRCAAGNRFVVETLSLLVDPNVAWSHAEHESSSLLRIAVIRGGIDVKPNVVHVREVAAQFPDHFMSGAFGAKARAFHNPEFLKFRANL